MDLCLPASGGLRHGSLCHLQANMFLYSRTVYYKFSQSNPSRSCQRLQDCVDFEPWNLAFFQVFSRCQSIPQEMEGQVVLLSILWGTKCLQLTWSKRCRVGFKESSQELWTRSLSNQWISRSPPKPLVATWARRSCIAVYLQRHQKLWPWAL